MKNIKRKIRLILQSCDIFGIQMSFPVQDSTKYRTKFGGILTIVLFLIIILSFYSSLTDLYSEQNLKVKFFRKLANQTIELDTEEFMMGIYLTNNCSINSPFLK